MGRLSKDRIIAAAIELLDADGEAALTFRALAAALETGSGALYHHVANKDELLAAATTDVLGRVLAAHVSRSPRAAIRAIALGVFDAIDAHPWIGGQLARDPWQSAMLQIFEAIGAQLVALRVRALFAGASALVSYIVGVAGQNAANARRGRELGLKRDAFLAAVVDRWTRQAPATHPFVHRIAPELRDHDDRAQFLSGIELILAGLEA